MKFNSKVIKTGNSQAISLNKTALKLSNFEIGDELDLRIDEETIIISKKENNIKDEIRDFFNNGGQYSEKLIDFEDSVGEEW